MKHGSPKIASARRMKFDPKITVKNDIKCRRSVTALLPAKGNQLRKTVKYVNGFVRKCVQFKRV